jgi:LPS export ABC transporter protein LptC
MIEFLMKRGLFIVLSVLSFSLLFIMLMTGREINIKLNMQDGSFFEDMKIIHKNNGITAWTLTANKAVFTESEEKAELNTISMFLPKNDVTLYADKGIYNLSEQSFTTDGAVRAEAKDYTITAETIDYEISSGTIEAAGRIEVQGRGFKIEGRGMKADEEQKIRIFNDVKATFYK